jgi:hypothetical protein
VKRIALGLALGALIFGGLQARGEKPLPSNVKAGFLCIHRYEGAWNANTGNGYYGGLQMDTSFQRTYGTWLYHHVGTANVWTRHQQLKVAYRAHRGWKGFAGRGFYPWPNTARRCGLL